MSSASIRAWSWGRKSESSDSSSWFWDFFLELTSVVFLNWFWMVPKSISLDLCYCILLCIRLKKSLRFCFECGAMLKDLRLFVLNSSQTDPSFLLQAILLK